jgi:hypothetical protein
MKKNTDNILERYAKKLLRNLISNLFGRLEVEKKYDDIDHYHFYAANRAENLGAIMEKNSWGRLWVNDHDFAEESIMILTKYLGFTKDQGEKIFIDFVKEEYGIQKIKDMVIGW